MIRSSNQAIKISSTLLTRLGFVVISVADYLPVIDKAGISRAINRRLIMKIWTKPAVRETEVGLEVTSYLPAEIDLI